MVCCAATEDGTPNILRNKIDTDSGREVRATLDLVGDKWSLMVVVLLECGTRRFMELRRDIGPISQRMLTRTLRRLERDGLVVRTVHPVVPPRVEYTLTPLGQTLSVAIEPVVAWALANQAELAAARVTYDDAVAPA